MAHLQFLTRNPRAIKVNANTKTTNDQRAITVKASTKMANGQQRTVAVGSAIVIGVGVGVVAAALTGLDLLRILRAVVCTQ